MRTDRLIAGLAALWAAMTFVSPVNAQEEINPDFAAKPSVGFLEIALDPDATAEQKRTVAAMMGFVKESDPVAAFEKLKASDRLILYGGCTGGLSDLTPVAQLTGLEVLILYNHSISDLTPLGSLQNLKRLRLEHNDIRDISPLAHLRKLESLQINDNHIEDLRPLSGLSRLHTLWLSRNRISDISPLRGLKELRDLHLSENKVTNLQVFADLSLCTLHLNGNGITDLSDLWDMNQSTTCFIALDLSDNAIRDVGPISKLERVVHLNLANNRITDASDLRNPELRWLDLEGNQLSRVPDLRNLDLYRINLRRNPIEDYADLIVFKKENPRVEILADEEFIRAYEDSIPLRRELVGSPLLGVWRTDRLETEWGPLMLELRFRPNGVFYQIMLAVDQKQEEGYTIDGRFSIRGDHLEMAVGRNTHELRFKIVNGVLVLGDDGERLHYTKVTE